MKVEQLMSRPVFTCKPGDSLSQAAQVLWQGDCGCVAVADGSRVLGMLTDRDICMAALTQGRALSEISVSSAMSQSVWSTRPESSLSDAAEIMMAHQVRRLPVIDAEGALVGLLSISDLALEAERQRRKRKKDISAAEVGEILAALSAPRLAKVEEPAAPAPKTRRKRGVKVEA
jgi:CBS domain-containing protein